MPSAVLADPPSAVATGPGRTARAAGRDVDMPIMTVRYGAGVLDKAAKADLARKLTDVMIRMEGGANTAGGRAFAWVLFDELALGDWWAGGDTGDGFISPPGRFLVRVCQRAENLIVIACQHLGSEIGSDRHRTFQDRHEQLLSDAELLCDSGRIGQGHCAEHRSDERRHA